MRPSSPIARAVFLLPAAGYHAVQKLRETAYKWGLLVGSQPPVPVVSVGNILLGGSGKTPFVIYLAELLRNKGMRPAVVSRGYRGTYRDDYLVVGRGDSSSPVAGPAEAGDEPFLIALRLRDIPVIVGRKRMHPVRAAQELCSCDVVILDDGFQHLALKRTVDIVLLNGSEDCMFPLGGLREPLSALDRAHVVILTGQDASVPRGAERYIQGKPLFRCRLGPVSLYGEGDPGTLSPDSLRDRDVFLLSAIAHPERFTGTARDLGWKVLEHLSFRDHHSFTDGELKEALQRGRGAPLVVTEKDWVKLPEWFRRTEDVFALRIAVALDEEETFLSTLLNLIGRA
jgi:tetraacyldisaccharide 4'-kinase